MLSPRPLSSFLTCPCAGCGVFSSELEPMDNFLLGVTILDGLDSVDVSIGEGERKIGSPMFSLFSLGKRTRLDIVK